MLEASAPLAHLRVRVPTAILTVTVSLLLAGCATGPDSTATPIASAQAPTIEGTDMPSMEAEAEGDSERTSNEIVTDLLGVVRDLMTYSGGNYTYFDETPFDPNDTAGYLGEGCIGQQGKDINVNVAGPPVADIEAVEQRVVDAYTARGWEVILREESEFAGGKIMDVSFADSTGKQFGFGLGSKATSIRFSSECSTHPSLDEPST